MIDDTDDEGQAKVCEDKALVCGGRSACDRADGSVCVGDKVCCFDKSETPCDPSGASTRVCCDLSVDKCEKDESGAMDCTAKDSTPPAGRRLLKTPSWARSAVGERRRPNRRAEALRELATGEGRAKRRQARLARRGGVSVAGAEMARPPWAAAATRPPVVVTTWEDVQSGEASSV